MKMADDIRKVSDEFNKDSINLEMERVEELVNQAAEHGRYSIEIKLESKNVIKKLNELGYKTFNRLENVRDIITVDWETET